MLQGYRTIIVAGAQFILGLLAMVGIALPEGAEAFIVDNATAVLGGLMALLAIKDWVLRLATKTPPGVKSN